MSVKKQSDVVLRVKFAVVSVSVSVLVHTHTSLQDSCRKHLVSERPQTITAKLLLAAAAMWHTIDTGLP